MVFIAGLDCRNARDDPGRKQWRKPFSPHRNRNWQCTVFQADIDRNGFEIPTGVASNRLRRMRISRI